MSHSSKPNALEQWTQISAPCKGKDIAVYLDYDGTLTPIVSDPSKAQVNDEMRTTVDTLSKKHSTSIVTGRRYDVISSFLRLPELHYAASHGFDVYGPHGHPLHAAAAEWLPILGEFRDSMQQRVGSIQGSLVEDCKFSISVHYRNVTSEQDEKTIAEAVDTTLQKLNASSEYKLKKHGGKKVWEVKPDKQWNKGKAVEYLHQQLYGEPQSAKYKNVVPVYVGDDVTDEDAFEALESFPDSITVFVVNNTPDRPTKAKYTVKDQDEVRELLERISKL